MHREAAFFGAALGGWNHGILPGGAVPYISLISFDLDEAPEPKDSEEEQLPVLQVGRASGPHGARPFLG